MPRRALRKRLPDRGRSAAVVVMGRIIGPYGVRGWLKVEHYTEQPGALLDFPVWSLRQGEKPWQEFVLEQGVARGPGLIAKLAGVETPEAVVALNGREIGVPRAQLPESPEGSYYFADLVGLRVVNLAGESLGEVSGVIETGANDVLAVQGERERLIPFIGPVIRQVKLDGPDGPGGIVVDWGVDF